MRADVIGIDIIERGAGRAVDELAIDLPDEHLVDLLLAEIGEVEGVDVENIRPLAGPPVDPAVTALRIAREVRQAGGGVEGFETLVGGALQLLGADWVALVDPTGSRVISSVGEDVPGEGWLCAFVLGATVDDSSLELGDLAVATLPDSGLALVVSRRSSPLRGREQDVLEGLAALL